MDQRAKDVLREAALAGTRQIVGALNDGKGGQCAWGVLFEVGVYNWNTTWAHLPVDGCHLCGLRRQVYYDSPIAVEGDLIVHLNNDHKLDFLAIAEKMPTTPEEA